MIVTKELYKKVKNTTKLGIARDEIADMYQISYSTVRRIQLSDTYDGYHELGNLEGNKYKASKKMSKDDSFLLALIIGGTIIVLWLVWLKFWYQS